MVSLSLSSCSYLIYLPIIHQYSTVCWWSDGLFFYTFIHFLRNHHLVSLLMIICLHPLSWNSFALAIGRRILVLYWNNVLQRCLPFSFEKWLTVFTYISLIIIVFLDVVILTTFSYIILILMIKSLTRRRLLVVTTSRLQLFILLILSKLAIDFSCTVEYYFIENYKYNSVKCAKQRRTYIIHLISFVLLRSHLHHYPV